MLAEFCTAASKNNTNDLEILYSKFVYVVSTVKAGGNVLVPCFASGVTYDLFECLAIHLDQAGLSSVPIYFVSPAAECSLAYANIYSEWY